MTNTLAADAPKLGRKRDPSRDAEILNAALDVLADKGYEGMTIEMVATRAKAGTATLYRRWDSKADLVIDAVACMKVGSLDLAALPDTGTLRGDLVAMIKPHNIKDGERKLKVMAAIVSMISRSPELGEAAHDAIIAPRIAANRILIQRAIDRGEIAAGSDIERLATVGQAMASYRVLVERKPVDREFLVATIDGVVLPAAGIPPQR